MLDGLGTTLSHSDLGILVAAAMAAGMARGFSGFGAALIFVPLASAVVGPRIAVPLLLVVDGVMAAGMIPAAIKVADRRDVMTMALGAVAGVPAGIWILTTVDPGSIRWAIVVVVLALLALLMSGWRYHGRPRPPITVGVGFVAGIFSGAAQIGGPPVVAYWLGGVIAPRIVRANIIAYFAVSAALSATGYIWNGLITTSILVLAACIAPVYGCGIWLGSRVFSLASETTFRYMCYAMIAVATLVSMPVFDALYKRG